MDDKRSKDYPRHPERYCRPGEGPDPREKISRRLRYNSSACDKDGWIPAFAGMTQVAKRIKWLFSRSYRYALSSWDAFIAKQFHDKKIIACYDLPTPQNKPYLCIFSHYDKDNHIADYVIYYLDQLSQCGCDIIFVSTSTSLSAIERKKIAPFCRKIIIKANRGRDFSAFKCGLTYAQNLSHYEKVILANDSVYGPFFPLTDIIQYGDKNNLDMWGATDSFEYRYHIQSYFVVFNKKMIQSHSFNQFWQGVYPLRSRTNIIMRYEIGMSSFFLRHGFKLGAFCPYMAIQQDLGLQSKLLNTTHYLWDTLITRYRYPFIKRELLAFNPAKVNILQWQQVIQHHTSFDINLIRQHLFRGQA